MTRDTKFTGEIIIVNSFGSTNPHDITSFFNIIDIVFNFSFKFNSQDSISWSKIKHLESKAPGP